MVTCRFVGCGVMRCSLKTYVRRRDTDDVAETSESPIALPSFYVDTAHIRRQPFTVHLLLGNMDVHGDVSPSMHLTLSPAFCRHLAGMLIAAAEAEGPSAVSGDAG